MSTAARGSMDTFEPDPGEEHLFAVSNNPFAFSPGHLSKLINPKSLKAFYKLGGLNGIAAGLRTNTSSGLSTDEAALDGEVTFECVTGHRSTPERDDISHAKKPSINLSASNTEDDLGGFSDRRRVFGTNKLPEKDQTPIWKLALDTWKDPVIISLTVAAIVSLGIGLWQTFDPTVRCLHGNETKTEWLEGVATLIAVVVIVTIGTGNEWQKARQFAELNKKKVERDVKVIRSGRYMEISVFDLMIGDVALLEQGDLVPADGIYISGYNIRCDESAMTGESDMLKKYPGDQVFKLVETGHATSKLDPFILSGSQVSEGHGTFLVTAIGINSSHGRMVMAIQDESIEPTPLQRKLSKFGNKIAKVGLAAAMLLLVILLIKFGIRHSKNSNNDKLPKSKSGCPIMANEAAGLEEPSRQTIEEEMRRALQRQGKSKRQAIEHVTLTPVAAIMTAVISRSQAHTSVTQLLLNPTEKYQSNQRVPSITATSALLTVPEPTLFNEYKSPSQLEEITSAPSQDFFAAYAILALEAAQKEESEKCKSLSMNCKKLHTMEMIDEIVRMIMISIGLLACAIPEGLPLAVTLALAFAMTKMVKDNNLVRIMQACETMGNATTICSDKTGTLTENKMTMVAATIGTEMKFGFDPSMEGDGNDGADDNQFEDSSLGVRSETRSITGTADALLTNIGADVKQLIKQSLVINSTAFETDGDHGPKFVGSKTESALLDFSRTHLGAAPVQEERANANVVQVVPFDSTSKYMATVIKLGNSRFRALVKGAPELLISKSDTILVDPSSDLSTSPLGAEEIESVQNIIKGYGSNSLRTLGLAYQEFDQWPPAGAQHDEDPSMAKFNTLMQGMTFIGIVGIKDPLREGVTEAVEDSRQAGVTVRMVTGDNMLTAMSIARECGIYTPETGGTAMEGSEFRKMSDEEMDIAIPSLQVLARSSPEDKQTLVKRLKALGETVAVTGDGTNDAPALKAADVGFSMVTGTDVAKEASSIVLMDDNFSSIVKAIMWGRAVNDAVKKFLQYQLTVNITAVVLTALTSIHSPREESILNAIQLLWLNLIMDTGAALALATDPPSRRLLKRQPDRKSDPLITLRMWKLIVGEALYQFSAITALYFIYKSNWMVNKQLPGEIRNAVRAEVGKQMKQAGNLMGSHVNLAAFADGTIVNLNAPHGSGSYELSMNTKDILLEAVKRVNTATGTLIFNAFVWMQIFNESNNRRLDNGLKVFEGVFRNPYFIAITVFMIAGQVLIINFAGKAFGIQRLGVMEWVISLVLGLGVFPVAMACRKFPDAWAASLLPLQSWRACLAPELYSPMALSRKLEEEYDSDSPDGSDQTSDGSEYSDLPPPLTFKEKVKAEVRRTRGILKSEFL